MKKDVWIGIGRLLLIGFLCEGICPITAGAQVGSGRIERRNAVPSPYPPITSGGRTEWFLKSTVGPQSLAAGVLSAGWGTAFNKPEEYGPQFSGFAKRYGMRLTGVAASNALEATLGALRHEDPRYMDSGGTIWGKVKHSATMTVMAYRPDGSLTPAYARYAGIAGSNFLSNSWRVDSESTARAAASRIALGFAGRFAGNVFQEFWHNFRGR